MWLIAVQGTKEDQMEAVDVCPSSYTQYPLNNAHEIATGVTI